MNPYGSKVNGKDRLVPITSDCSLFRWSEGGSFEATQGTAEADIPGSVG